MREPRIEPNASTRIRDGVEWFSTGEDEECQCARCGSSCSPEVTGYGCGDGVVVYVCLSSPEWCKSNPIRGREFQCGAGR